MISITGKPEPKQLLTGIILGLLVAVVTFPAPDWAYGPGIDPPLAWVFNSLFGTGDGNAPVIIFPHGPLAFFTYPLEQNAWLVAVVTILLKIFLVFNVAGFMGTAKTWVKWLAASFLAYIIAVAGGFIMLVLANIMAGYVACYKSEFPGWSLRNVLVILIIAFAFYIKTYSAIISGLLFVSFQGYRLFKTRDIRPLLIDLSFLISFILIFWILQYGNFNGFFTFVEGMVRLAQDNSSAAAYYPYNNWLFLSIFIFLIISIFIINKDRDSRFFSILIALSLFAAWKHGMAREDIFHVRGFFAFVLICLAIFIIFHHKKFIINILIAIVALYFLSLNLKNAENYSPLRYNWFSAENLIRFVSDKNTLQDEAMTATMKATEVNILPESLLTFINDFPTDVYPWDYSVIPANNLNWRHRPVIHSYASYTPWLDRHNANHFGSSVAPEYIVWEKDKITSDVNGGRFNSIDGRYLLNDEPMTILELLKRYDPEAEEGKFLLLQKRETGLQPVVSHISSVEGQWMQWIRVPGFTGDILRVKLSFKKTFLQRMKSFFYKDEQFWIYLRLDNGEIHKYRIGPGNAVEGLWINPYLYNYDQAFKVDDIMFVASNRGILTDNVFLDWEKIDFNDDGNRSLNFFNVENDVEDTLISSSMNGFEEDKLPGWSPVKADLKREGGFSGKYSLLVNPESFSAGYSMSLDSIPYGELTVSADSWLSAPGYKLKNKISLVISVENDKGNVLWHSVPVDYQMIDDRGWNHIYNHVSYNHTKPGCILKIYFLNSSDRQAYLDDFRVMISACN